MKYLAKVLKAAQAHGEDSDDPEHEVGDLQAIVYALHALLTPAQRKAFEANEECRTLIETWGQS